MKFLEQAIVVKNILNIGIVAIVDIRIVYSEKNFIE